MNIILQKISINFNVLFSKLNIIAATSDKIVSKDIALELYISKWLISIGIPEKLSIYATNAIIIIGILFASFIVNLIAKFIFFKIGKKIIEKTQTKWDDVIYEKGVIKRFARILPALVIFIIIPILFQEGSNFGMFLRRCASAYMIWMGFFVLIALIDAGHYIYNTFEISRKKPIKGYLQILKIFLYIISGIFVITTILNKDPWGIIGGIGGFTAILLLIFKDSIMGLVASIKLSSSQMVRLGDWITVPGSGIDGDVIDISLHNVTVQNFDKTISTIPSYTLIGGAFKNWRGMSELGVRRIMRSINIDLHSIKICTNEMIEKFKKINLIEKHIQDKLTEINHYNNEKNVDQSLIINGKQLTNIGVFRAYLVEYLKKHPNINQNFSFLVRQLEPTETGLPIQIYVFSKIIAWAEYENVQSEIFEHIFAVIREFDLKVFQNPSGEDIIQALTNKANK